MVQFTKDLECAYSSGEVQNLTVYDFLLKKLRKSECVSSHDGCDCLFIGGFNVEITKDKSRFFSQEIYHGYPKYDHKKLHFILKPHLLQYYIVTGSTSFEQEYKRPSSMADLAGFIDDFINLFYIHRLILVEEYKDQMVEREKNDPELDLPF